MGKQTLTTPTGLELQLKPLPKFLVLKLAGQSLISVKKSQEVRQARKISVLVEAVEAGVILNLTEEQKLEAQAYLQEFEREYPGVLANKSDKFIYVMSQFSGSGKLSDLIKAIVELSGGTYPAPTGAPVVASKEKQVGWFSGFKRRDKSKK